MVNNFLQSVIIPKDKFTEEQALKWIRKNKFKDYGTKIKNYKTTNFYRFRQYPPSWFVKGTFRTKQFTKSGINFIIGEMKREKRGKPFRKYAK